MPNTETNTPLFVRYSTANEIMLSSLATKVIRKFARKGWNGKKLHVQIHGSIPTNHVELGNGENAYIDPFFVIVNKESGRVNTWIPSVSDLQAEDWYEVI